MRQNKNFIVAGVCFFLVILLVFIFVSGAALYLPRGIYFTVSGIFPLVVIVLLAIALLALMTNKASGTAGIPAGKVAIVGLLVVIAGIFVPVVVFEAFFHNQGQGVIEYTVSVTGLEGTDGGSIAEVVVPLPVRNGEPLIPAEKITGRTFGDWNAGIVVLPGSGEPALVFHNNGSNVTGINAEFYEYVPEGLVVDNDNRVYLSPVEGVPEDLHMAGRFSFVPKTPGDLSDYSYVSSVSLPDLSGSVQDENETVSLDILLKVHTGKTGFMTVSNDYTFEAAGPVKLNGSGVYPVNVNVHVS